MTHTDEGAPAAAAGAGLREPEPPDARRMRILIVNDYASMSGGAEILLHALRRGLRERGHDARLFASRALPAGARSEADFECLGTLTALRTPLQAYNPSARTALARAIEDFQPHVVHVGIFLTQLSPAILSALRATPALFHVQWYRPVCPLGTKRLPNGSSCEVPWGRACLRNRCVSVRAWGPLMIQRALWERGRDAFDLFVAPSRRVQARLEEAGLGPAVVVPNAVPRVGASPRPAAALSEGPVPRPGASPAVPKVADPDDRDPFTIGFAGRWTPEKGVDVLVEAFARVVLEEPRTRLLLLGDGDERRGIEARVAALGLEERVESPGWLPRTEAEDRLRGVAVQAVPSLWEEPFGLVAAEALMRGTPVVVSDTGGLSEVVEQGRSGWTVPPGDVEALAGALLGVLADPEGAARRAREGQRTATDRFSEDVWLDRMIAIYRRLAGA